MVHFRNAKSLFIAARTGAQLFMRFTCECELIVCTKGCEPGLAFKKRVKAIRECLLKRVCLWGHTLFFLCQERALAQNTAILLTLNASLSPFSSHFLLFFLFCKRWKTIQESFLVPVLLARRNRPYFSRFQSTLCPI